MSLTMYDTRTLGVEIAGNTATVLTPLVADPLLSKATIAEINAGTAIQCAIKELDVSGTANTRSDQLLCDTDEAETPGTVKWSIAPIIVRIKDPQQADTFVDGLVRGDVVYIIQRRGLPHSTAFAAAQRISITRAVISLVEDMPVQANADGNKYEVRIHFAAKAHNRTAVVSAT